MRGWVLGWVQGFEDGKGKGVSRLWGGAGGGGWLDPGPGSTEVKIYTGGTQNSENSLSLSPFFFLLSR